MTRPQPLWVLTAVAWAATVCCPSAAHAQAPSPLQTLPEVRVTGSALPRASTDTALPLSVLTRTDIERSGARSTTELLQSLPMVQGVTRQASAVGPETQGFAGVSIHDLGEPYTLVLLNGHRVVSFAGQTLLGAMNGVDLNTLPLAAVERIELLSTGASAVYGADAIGGVINVITRRGADLSEATVGLTLPRDGGREWRISAFKGVGDVEQDGHNLSLSAGASHRDALRAADRRFAQSGLIDFTEGGQRYRLLNGLSTNSSPANFAVDGGGLYNPYLAANGQCPTGQVLVGQACWYDYAAQADLLPQRDDQHALASYTRQVAPGQQWQFDVLLSRSRSTVQQAPAATAFGYWSLTPDASNGLQGQSFNDYGGLAYGNLRLDGLGPRVTTDTSTLIDLALRWEGRHQGWQWSSGVGHSVNTVEGRVKGVTTNAAVYDLIAAGEYKPWLPTSQQSGLALQSLRDIAYDGNWQRSRATLWQWQAQASRDVAQLDGGPLRWSLGMDAISESLQRMPSALAQARLANVATGEAASTPDAYYARVGDTFGTTPFLARRHRVGLFTEWQAPLTPAWELGAALRADRDSLGGSALTGQTHARWRASPTVTWRGSAGTGFKAPALAQAAATQQNQGDTQYHRCDAALQAALAAQGQTCTLATDVYFPILAKGNPQLSPERSVHASIGFRIEPATGWAVGVDAWAVLIRQRVGVLPESTVFADPMTHPEAFTTDGNGNAALLQQPRNLGTSRSSGIDFDIATRHPTPLGPLSTRLTSTALIGQRAQPYPGGPSLSNVGQDTGGGATLRWRGRWSATLQPTRAWSHTLTLAFQSGYRESEQTVQVLDAQGQTTADTATLRLKVPAFLTWDWLSSWQAPSGLRLNVGVRNVLDTPPPLSINTGGGLKANMVGYDERFFDPRGRTVVVEARLAF